MKSHVLTTDVPTDKIFPCISSLREEIEYLREENRAKTLIIKQLTEIKTTVNLTSMSFTCSENSTDKTTQNSNNVIDKTIQNNYKEHLKNKKKNANKDLTNTKTLNTTDNFASTYFEHPVNEKSASTNGKKRRKLAKRKTRKRRKKIIAVRLQIGTTTTRTEIMRIKLMFIFLATAWLKN